EAPHSKRTRRPPRHATRSAQEGTDMCPMTTPIGMDDKAMAKGIELRLDTLIQGLLNNLPAGTTQIVVGGVTYPVSDFIAKVKEVNMPFKTKRAARTTLRQLSMTEEQDRKAALDLLADARAGLGALLSTKNVE